ncbi:MAG TPA: hypothetical protein DD735_04400, partial [Clostridiales bacterium]|nr:hypothetical protein [Clostridiales bacterium]
MDSKNTKQARRKLSPGLSVLLYLGFPLVLIFVLIPVTFLVAECIQVAAIAFLITGIFFAAFPHHLVVRVGLTVELNLKLLLWSGAMGLVAAMGRRLAGRLCLR